MCGPMYIILDEVTTYKYVLTLLSSHLIGVCTYLINTPAKSLCNVTNIGVFTYLLNTPVKSHYRCIYPFT